MKKIRKRTTQMIIATAIVSLLLGFLFHITISITKAEYHALLLYCDTLQSEVTDLTERVIALENAQKLQTDGINAAYAKAVQKKYANIPKNEIVWKTPVGEKYHKKDCGSLGGGGIAITLEEATIAGLEPCKKCFK